jgi:hypothetical protein
MLASKTPASNGYFGSKYKTKGFTRDLKQGPVGGLLETFTELMLVLRFCMKNILSLFYIINSYSSIILLLLFVILLVILLIKVFFSFS